MLLEKISFIQLVAKDWRLDGSWKSGLASSKAEPILMLSARIKFSLPNVYQL